MIEENGSEREKSNKKKSQINRVKKQNHIMQYIIISYTIVNKLF